MAIVDINTLKQWFSSGKKPTQEQFWNWIDSFRHRNEKLDISEINELSGKLNSKAATNHTHEDLAKKDASNVNAEDWQIKLGLNDLTQPTEATVKLANEYAEYELTPENFQSDLNTKLVQAINNVNQKKAQLPISAGVYNAIKIDEEGYYEWVPKSIPKSSSYTLQAIDLENAQISFPYDGNADGEETTLLYIRGLYVGVDCYVFNNETVTLDQTKIVYPIEAGDLIEFVYKQLPTPN